MKQRLLVTMLVLLISSCSRQGTFEPTQTASPLPSITPTIIPTSIPTSTVPPVYSYFPAISAANVTKVVNINEYDGGVSSLVFSPNGKYLAATFDNGVGVVWDISTADNWHEWADAPKDVFVSKGKVSFSRDNIILATGGTLLEFPSIRVIRELQGSVVFNPINETLAVFDWNNISILNLDNQLVLNFKEDSAGITDVTFSPDGNLLGEAINEDVNIWRISDHTLLYSFPPIEHNHPAHFNTLAYAFFAFSPDNKFIVTGTKDFPYEIRIWNLQTGKHVKDLNIYADCVAFSQDGNVIILADGNNIIFRTFPEGDVIRELEVEIYYMSPADYVTACVVSKDGKLLAIGDSGGTVNIWGVPAYAP